MQSAELRSCIDTGIPTVSVTSPARDVVQRMEQARASAVVVTDEDRRPVGIITERDVLCMHAALLRGEAVSDWTARELMTPQPVTLPIDESLYSALVISQNHRIRHLPVVNEEGRLVGMVTHPMLINAHLRLIDEHAERLRRAVAEETESLSRTNRELLTLSLTDAMLGIGNRRAMEADLRHTLTLAQAHGKALTAMLIDVDHFKRYNDHYGHLAGDEALRQVVARIQKVIRNADRLYRYGGEEFLLMLPGCNGTQALEVGRRILTAFEQDPIEHEATPLGRLTVSIGIASLATSPDEAAPVVDMEDFIRVADAHLYRAKSSGRNCMCGPVEEMQAA